MAGKVIGRVLLALLLILLLLAVFGTAAHAAGLVDDTVDAANEYSKYPLDNYQLDFYVDSGWDWLDGTGWTVHRKQVMLAGCMPSQIYLDNRPCLSNATGYLIQEAYSLDFIFLYGGFHWEKYADPCRRYRRRLVSGGFISRFLFDSLILVVGFTLPTQGLNGNHKSHPCRCEFRGGVLCCLLPLSLMLRIISGENQ